MSVPVVGAPPRQSQWRMVARALRHRNYQLFFFGQGTSLIGTWMQRIALSWLVYRMTDSKALLGVVGFCSQILTFLLAPLGGVAADRSNKRFLLVLTQTAAMIQAFILAGLAFADRVSVWHIIVLSLLLGLVNAFDIPIRQSFVVEMLESREDLPNAIALNSFMFNMARLIGPSLAGILVAVTGEAVCFLVNGVTFLAVIAALLAMKIKPADGPAHHPPLLQHLKEGMVYAFRSVPIRTILMLITIVSLFAAPYQQVLLPVFAKDILPGGARTLGFLMAATGLGALVGAVFLAGRRSVHGLGKVLSYASGVFGLGLVAFSWSEHLWLSLALITVAGAGMMVQMASCNTLLQTVVDDDKRGRVMSLYTMSFMGIAPFGSLLVGWLAEIIGAPWTLTLGGLGCIAVGLFFAARFRAFDQHLRPDGERPARAPVPGPVTGRPPNG